MVMSVGVASCIKPLDGSRLEMIFTGFDVPGDGMTNAPPAGAHYTLFARVNGTPGGTDGAFVPVSLFTVQPLINLDDPCAIAFTDSDCRDYQSTCQGLDPPNDCPPGCVPGSLIKDILGRNDLTNARAIQSGVTAVVSYTTVTPPAVPANATPATRLEMCQQFLAGTVPTSGYPAGVPVSQVYYIGNYRVLANPIYGVSYGPNQGALPSGLNLGGSSITTDYNLEGLNDLYINWSADVDPTTIATDIGTPYLAGSASQPQSGVYFVTFFPTAFGNPAAQGSASVYYDIGQDSQLF
jgi:hypothetical protein